LLEIIGFAPGLGQFDSKIESEELEKTLVEEIKI
jgi:hypothetical protein